MDIILIVLCIIGFVATIVLNFVAIEYESYFHLLGGFLICTVSLTFAWFLVYNFEIGDIDVDKREITYKIQESLTGNRDYYITDELVRSIILEQIDATFGIGYVEDVDIEIEKNSEKDILVTYEFFVNKLFKKEVVKKSIQINTFDGN